jgi:endoglucanase
VISPLRIKGTRITKADGQAVRLRGVGLGGWLNMENFITGYSANESLMRATVRDVLGPAASELFFERLLSVFFTDEDAALLARTGLNCVRVPVNYRHFEDDSAPLKIKPDGFRHLDRVVEACARHGIYTVIDLHAAPGAQNHHWHSDNPTHVPLLWVHRDFQDRVVNLWEHLADHYNGHPGVAGYNLLNEPADESRAVVGRLYQRLVTAVRAIDPDHILFLDGNTYSTEFDIFSESWAGSGQADGGWAGGLPDNTVYACHDYAAAGLGRGGPYPGLTDGTWFDADALERKFLQRSEFSRRTGTPVWVGEFGPIYTGDPGRDAQRRQLLADQLDIYRRHDAGWSIWTYKDLGPQGLVTVRPDSPYGERFGAFVAKKNRLAADSWGSDGVGVAEVTGPVQDLIEREFPGFEPYPWGRRDWVKTLLLNITVAQPLAWEYAELFRGLREDDLIALADSFALGNCSVRTTLADQLERG